LVHDAGKNPENRLFDRDNVAKLVRFPNASGMLPFIAALERSRVVSAVADDIEIGIGPVRRGFEVTLKIVKLVNEENISGRLPFKLLDARLMETTCCESAVHCTPNLSD